MSILDLPPEILSNVFENIWRPSDLKNICLTSKDLQAYAVPILYKHVELELGTSEVEDYAASNFQHTQSLAVSASFCAAEMTQTVYKDFLIVMDLIPRNQLRKFRWCVGGPGTVPMRATEYRYLFEKQPNLQELRGCIVAGFDSALHTLDTPTQIFRSHTLRHLAIHFRSSCTWWSTLWQIFPKLDSFELEVRNVGLTTSGARTSYSLATRPLALQLKRLVIRDPARSAPHFKDCRTIYHLIFESFDLSVLEHLTLDNFAGLSGILLRIMRIYEGCMPRITYLELIGIERQYNAREVSEFLSQLRGLETLKLAFHWLENNFKDCMIIPSICSHGLTLQTLFISVQYSHLFVVAGHRDSTTIEAFPHALLMALLSTCPNLEYLCLPGPYCEMAYPIYSTRTLHCFTSYNDSMLHLRTLCISNFPCIDGGCARDSTRHNLPTAPELTNPHETFTSIRNNRADFRTLLLPSPSPERYQAYVSVGAQPVRMEELRAVKYVEPRFREVEGWYVGLAMWDSKMDGGRGWVDVVE